MPIVHVAQDPDTGAFVLLKEAHESSNKTRGDSMGDGRVRSLRENVVPAIQIQGASRGMQQQIDSPVYRVRQCFCYYHSVEKPYCPIERDACGIPRPENAAIIKAGCFATSSRTVLIRNAWPVIVLWYGALVIFMLFTEQGRNARYFMWRRCCNRNLNNDLIDRMLRRPARPARRGLLERIRGRRPRQRRLQDAMLQQLQMANEINAGPPAAVHQPTRLALKTTRYVSADDDTSHNEEVSCTICFAEIQNGDRVGALPCNHIFHVDCLKVWLPRRNVCPLCQAPDVANPVLGETAARPEQNAAEQQNQAQYTNENEQSSSTETQPNLTNELTDVQPGNESAAAQPRRWWRSTLEQQEQQEQQRQGNNQQEESQAAEATTTTAPPPRWWRASNDGFRGRGVLQRDRR